MTKNSKSIVINLIFISIKMTQNNSLNINPLNSQLNKLKSAMKNGTDVALRLSSNVIARSDDKVIFHMNCY